jgi:CBS-domain-containing membrane protein
MDGVTVKDIMTADAVSVKPETPLVDVATLLTQRQFNGVPVVDEHGQLIGIITEYNLISGASGVHLPTLQKVLSQIPVFSKDKKEFSKDVEDVMKLTARDVMNNDPFTLPNTATYDETVKAFQSHHAINPIPVVDSQRRLVGVVSRFDVLKPLAQSH